MKIPEMLLPRLYTRGSLVNDFTGFHFSLENRLSDVRVTRILGAKVGPFELPATDLEIELGDGRWRSATELTPETPEEFTKRKAAHVRSLGHRVPCGAVDVEITVEVEGIGPVTVKARDQVTDTPRDQPLPLPRPEQREHLAAEGPSRRHRRNLLDGGQRKYSPAVVLERQRFVEEFSGARLRHVAKPSFDPEVTQGNIENFSGVAQIPLGFAGPLRVNGQHAQGEFIIPLATTEGTLVASYNRGMKVLNRSGGVTCTVQQDHMQRAPVFIFDSAREAFDFAEWVREHMADIRRNAESTTSVGKLQDIETYLASKFAHLRFNFSTGDAAGQNMVGKATYAACKWILAENKTIRRFFLEANLATDKKPSHINLLRTRGKRVTAECVINRTVLHDVMRVSTETIAYHWGVASVGSILSGANNNGLHSPNALAAMFIATGQDAANVAEGSAGIVYAELTPDKDLYLSITIPALIVATHGGGTKLPTQRECLEVMGCFGKGKAKKFAEIVAGVVLAGEISLAAAISSLEWVSSHERYGRNR